MPPVQEIMVCIYVSIYVSVINPTFVALWFLRYVYGLKCPKYSGILIRFTCDGQVKTELFKSRDWSSYSMSAMKIIDEDR